MQGKTALGITGLFMGFFQLVGFLLLFILFIYFVVIFFRFSLIIRFDASRLVVGF